MKQFLSLAKINCGIPNDEKGGLRRRSSAHASSVSKFRLNSLKPHIIPELIIDALTNPTQDCDDPIQKHLNGEQYSPSNSPKHSAYNQQSNNSLNLSSANTSSNNSKNASIENLSNMTLGQRLKPRSRSLIRRTSKKVNKIKDPNSEPDDCYIQ